MAEQVEEQGLVVVKDGFLAKVAKFLRKIFFRGKENNAIIEEDEDFNEDKPEIELISEENEFVQKEILDARRAYRKYVINNNKNISKEVLSYVIDRIKENETKIRQIIEINNDELSYEEILEMLENENESIGRYKEQNDKTGFYNVPIGVVGIECNDAKDTIEGIFKAISTRNSIIVLHNNYNVYSTESLILLIVKECLKNFYIDDNLIQMFEKEEIDLKKLDKLIQKDGEITGNKLVKKIYLYQENDELEYKVINEIDRLKNSKDYKAYEIKPIKGEFSNVINYLNNNNDALAVCMYTNNSPKAYKFINWINSPNVFVNTGVKNAKNHSGNVGEFYNSKYVLHKDVF